MSRTIRRSTQGQVLASDHDRGSLNKLTKVNFVYKAYLGGGTQNKSMHAKYIYLKLG